MTLARSTKQHRMPATPDSAELLDAFQAFERSSRFLTEHYDQLREEVARLNHALEQSHQQRLAELEERERVAARLKNLLKALPGGVVVIDGEGFVEQFNSAAGRILEHISVGLPWAAIVSANVSPRWDDGHDISLRNGRRVNISTQSLGNEAGQIVLLTDVSETRRLQDQLNLHKRLSANTQMAAALAHQLRTPLASALLLSGQAAGLADPATTRRVGRIRDSLRHLERLVEDFLLYARGGEMGAEATSVDGLMAEFHLRVAEMNLPESFTVSFPSAMPTLAVRVNSEAVVSVMLNLVQNAFQQGGDDNAMDITARCDGGFLCIAFSDNGPGIASDRASEIFEPFVTSRPGGTGMGLAIARSVARAHGGELMLDPSYADGARFELRLPLVELPAADQRNANGSET
ncbi:MAG: PAS domain-containing sensor histidine kinase [Gammaproteobacteria bacterium]|nr:PAS domain-containing sensor histidine kinase [Gammaproteobacteria bacterium]